MNLKALKTILIMIKGNMPFIELTENIKEHNLDYLLYKSEKKHLITLFNLAKKLLKKYPNKIDDGEDTGLYYELGFCDTIKDFEVNFCMKKDLNVLCLTDEAWIHYKHCPPSQLTSLKEAKKPYFEVMENIIKNY